MKIFHYTKGISFANIMMDGLIKTERQSGITQIDKLTNFVWLTESKSFPKTALPLLPGIAGTNLELQILSGGYIDVDLDIVGKVVGGIYRIGFEDSDARFVKWRGSVERGALIRNPEWLFTERIANRVRDDISKFWISRKEVSLTGCSIEIYEQGKWILLMQVDSNSNVTCLDEQKLMQCIRQSASTMRFASNMVLAGATRVTQ